MTEYQRGRIYSGVVGGNRELIMRLDGTRYVWGISGNALKEDQVTEVRGPLVVLDLPENDAHDWHILAKETRNNGWKEAADQIEAQAGPPKIGVHEARRRAAGFAYIRWDGRVWRMASGALCDVQDWVSVRYIGPGSSDD